MDKISEILKRTHTRDTRMHNNQTQKAGFKPGEMTYLKLCRERQTEGNCEHERKIREKQADRPTAKGREEKSVLDSMLTLKTLKLSTLITVCTRG